MSGATNLELRDVSKSFGGQLVLGATSLTVASGSFCAIVGPSGCGKSTLFNIVAGLATPDTGDVLVEGASVRGKAGHVGYMLQKDLLVPWRTVEDNILMIQHLTGRVSAAQRTRAREIAARYGLGDFLSHYPAALSGGMRQRVAFMRTLMSEQQLLLLDEPFGALDAHTRFDMQEWLLAVWRDSGQTILFITHDVDEAIFLADRVVVMSPRPGRVVADFPNPLPRPRGLSALRDPSFVSLKSDIMQLLHGEDTHA